MSEDYDQLRKQLLQEMFARHSERMAATMGRSLYLLEKTANGNQIKVHQLAPPVLYRFLYTGFELIAN